MGSQPGPPITSGGVTLPGAEYFALAPNRSIALGPRLFAQNATAPTISVPASTIGGANQSGLLEPLWTPSSGVFIVRAYGLFVPADTSGELQIIAARMGVGIAPLNILIDLGLPTSTLASPANPQIVIFDRDALVVAQDMPALASGGQLSIILQIQVKNLDTTNPHSFQFGFTCIWHRVNGFVQ